MTLLADDIIALAYGEAYRPAGRLLAVLIWAVPLALVSGHYRYALIACDHERLEFRCNAIGAAVAIGLGVLLIPSHGAFSAALALVASTFVVLVLAHAAAREAWCLGPVHRPGLAGLVRARHRRARRTQPLGVRELGGRGRGGRRVSVATVTVRILRPAPLESSPGPPGAGHAAQRTSGR